MSDQYDPYINLAKMGYERYSTSAEPVPNYTCIGEISDNAFGGYARIYKKDTEPGSPPEYVVTFTGTVSIENDSQYWESQAIERYDAMHSIIENLAEDVSREGGQLVFCGDSLGGFQAQIAAREFGAKAYVTNTFGLFESTIQKISTTPSVSFDHNADSDQVSYFNMDGEPLQVLGGATGTYFGQQFTIPSSYGCVSKFLFLQSPIGTAFSLAYSIDAHDINYMLLNIQDGAPKVSGTIGLNYYLNEYGNQINGYLQQVADALGQGSTEGPVRYFV